MDAWRATHRPCNLPFAGSESTALVLARRELLRGIVMGDYSVHSAAARAPFSYTDKNLPQKTVWTTDKTSATCVCCVELLDVVLRSCAGVELEANTRGPKGRRHGTGVCQRLEASRSSPHSRNPSQQHPGKHWKHGRLVSLGTCPPSSPGCVCAVIQPNPPTAALLAPRDGQAASDP